MREDPRNYLFESYEKILNHLKPKIFVFENVMGLLSARLGNRKTFEVIKEKLGVNYNLSSNNNDMILDACEYGVPQIRKRVILIGIRKDINYKIEKLFFSGLQPFIFKHICLITQTIFVIKQKLLKSVLYFLAKC